MPSPTEDQWLAVKMCTQEVTNCKTKAKQNLSVLTVCGTPVIMTDIPMAQVKTLPSIIVLLVA